MPKSSRKDKDVVDYLCVLDFEATCNKRGPPPKPQEIIEFPTILVNAETGEVEGREFHHYVKPDVHPTLSDFCKELTGIRQAQVDKGIPLSGALAQHETWLDECGLVPWRPTSNTDGRNDDDDLEDCKLIPSYVKVGKEEEEEEEEEAVNPKKTFLYVTCGDWDLDKCLPDQLEYHRMDVPVCFRQWINIKVPFSNMYQRKKKAGSGMVGMLRYLGLELQGRHHSGIDDCQNTTRIAQENAKEWLEACMYQLLRLESEDLSKQVNKRRSSTQNAVSYSFSHELV